VVIRNGFESTDPARQIRHGIIGLKLGLRPVEVQYRLERDGQRRKRNLYRRYRPR
jgi:hypothetical protein